MNCTHLLMPTASLLFFVLPQRKVTKESGTLAIAPQAKGAMLRVIWGWSAHMYDPTYINDI